MGVGIPTLGAMVAKLTHAPHMVIAMESGSIGVQPCRLVLGIGDNACVENSICTKSLLQVFSDQQRGYFDLGTIGGAQVDKYGNVNSTVIFGERDYHAPAPGCPAAAGPTTSPAPPRAPYC